MVDRKTDVSGEGDTGCGMYIRAAVIGVLGRHSHDIYFAGMTPMFSENMILRGEIADIGGPDGLIPGMILGTKGGKGVAHGGVYAGSHDFGNGPEHAVYSLQYHDKPRQS